MHTILSSGDQGAIIKAANLINAKGAATVTPAELHAIMSEFTIPH